MTQKQSLIATMTTNKGPIRLELFAEETPLTVANFVNLIQAPTCRYSSADCRLASHYIKISWEPLR